MTHLSSNIVGSETRWLDYLFEYLALYNNEKLLNTVFFA